MAEEFAEPCPEDEEELYAEMQAEDEAAAYAEYEEYEVSKPQEQKKRPVDENEEEGRSSKKSKEVPERTCKCGVAAMVLTSHSERNPDRLFYKCDTCNFFEWCDEARREETHRQPPESPNKQGPSCPTCKSALAERTSNSEANPGRKYVKCNACNYFKWADELARSANNFSPEPRPSPRNDGPSCPTCKQPLAERTSNSAANPGRKYYKCFTDNYFKWADEVASAAASSSSSSPIGARAQPCFRCGQPGHFARDCKASGKPAFGSTIPKPISKSPSPAKARSGTCFRCNQTGHWARDCASCTAAWFVTLAAQVPTKPARFVHDSLVAFFHLRRLEVREVETTPVAPSVVGSSRDV